ncbi:hypothetical protein R3P38DRAFT_3608894 [Favolaschia claudopus]|uniref:HNH nuclease domain-containing protein n=1 Tax=Favolaschia claudopus TaxID=2862362 RepID=A0AAW0A805_9AGAR
MTYPRMPPVSESWPLPPSNAIGLDLKGRKAWEVLLSAEREALAALKAKVKYQDKLVAVRLVAWFLKDFWEHQRSTAYKRLLLKIFSCEGVVEKVFQLGLVLRNHLIRVFYAPTPTPSEDASRPSYDQHTQNILMSIPNVNALENEGRTRTEARADTVLRDGHKCVITGLYDKTSIVNFPKIAAKAKTERASMEGTQVAYLFSGTVTYAASILAILQMFGLDSVADKLLGKRVNNLCNVMTMITSLHDDFEQFIFWLEAVPGEEHTYNLVTRYPDIELFFGQLSQPPRQVKFSVDPEVRNNAGMKLPDSELIAVRAACARVAAMSGVADHIRLLMQDRDNVETLTDSDTSIHLLDSLLFLALPLEA